MVASRLRALLLALVVSVLPSTLVAQEAVYLAIKGEGTASVVLSNSNHTAYITDGGNARTGIAGAKVDGQPVLDLLLERGYNKLVITCSHPHADHMGGLKEMLRSQPAKLALLPQKEAEP